MRKFIQSILTVILFLFILPISHVVSAQENKIKDIHIDVQLHEDGSATIRENRQTEMYEDTELYIKMNNLQDSELLNFQVEGFTEETDWDIDASFEDKAYHYGVIDVDNGYELAWGISNYGPQEYNVTYSLSNMVRELEDGQALFWNFDTFLSHPTDKMTLEIHAPFPLDEEVLDFYGFGFEGPIDIVDGHLEWTGYGLTDSNDVIVLTQFPSGTFNTHSTVNMTLAEQKEMATEGSSYNDTDPMPTWLIVLLSGMTMVGLGVAGSSLAYARKTNRIRKKNNHFFAKDWIKKNKDITSQKPPKLNGDIGDYAYLLKKVVTEGGGFANYFFAYLLIWSFEDRLQIETNEEERFLLGSKTTAQIQIRDFKEELEMNKLSFDEYVDLFEMGESTLEEVIWGMLLETADQEGIIEGEDVADWSKENAKSIYDLVQLLDEVSLDWLEQNDYMTVKKEKVFGMPAVIESLTEKGEKIVNEIIQFDHFIEKIDERSLADFDHWQELIVWAALFGKAEEVVKYLEEFEPSTWAYLEETYPYVYGRYYGWHYIYTRNSAGMQSGGHSSTGGGFSSGGGGAGAGGGGGGGSR